MSFITLFESSFKSPLKQSLLKPLLVISLLIGLAACGGGGSDPAVTPTPDPTPDPTPIIPPVTTPDTTAPSSPLLVNASSAAQTTADISWQISTDDQTPTAEITYQIHLSPSPNFAPTTATQITQLQAASNFVFAQLTANTTYFTKVVALDNNNNTAISNELSFTTAQAAAIRTAKPVQVIADNINTRAETNQLIFNTAELTEPIQTNQILVAKTEQGGHLRTVTNVIDSNGQTTVTTAPASLADVFEQVSFSTETVIASPAAAPVTAAAAGTATTSMKSFAPASTAGHQPQVQRRYTVDSNNKVQIEKRQSWQQTGFTLIEDITPKNQIKGIHKAATQAANVTLKNENNRVTAGGNLSITGAKIVVLNPGDQLRYQVYAEVVDHNGKIELKSFKLRHLKHDDNKSRNDFGATSTLSTTETSGARALKKQLTLNWAPNASHVSNKPYIATFRAVEDGDKGLDDSLEYQVHIIVTNGSTEIAPTKTDVSQAHLLTII